MLNGYRNFYGKSEVIDLLDETNQCELFANFPYAIIGASGGLVEVLGRYGGLSCGGRYQLNIEPRCYSVFEDATTVIGMSNHRIYADSISINQTNIWITGGLTTNP